MIALTLYGILAWYGFSPNVHSAQEYMHAFSSGPTPAPFPKEILDLNVASTIQQRAGLHRRPGASLTFANVSDEKLAFLSAATTWGLFGRGDVYGLLCDFTMLRSWSLDRSETAESWQCASR